uniref:HDC06759 n=1 Tax=Drosophila melanogaster TaxID=7227 RepID=Q6IGB1_DROME|nr:TPA_inf: HDC06759 [Drosophila melanogaster]
MQQQKLQNKCRKSQINKSCLAVEGVSMGHMGGTSGGSSTRMEDNDEDKSQRQRQRQRQTSDYTATHSLSTLLAQSFPPPFLFGDIRCRTTQQLTEFWMGKLAFDSAGADCSPRPSEEALDTQESLEAQEA